MRLKKISRPSRPPVAGLVVSAFNVRDGHSGTTNGRLIFSARIARRRATHKSKGPREDVASRDIPASPAGSARQTP